ncbi:MAG: acyltransferase [Croceibacterium sp.]
MTAGKHWQELDGLRGVLALGVVLLHFGVNNLAAQIGWRGLTFNLAVDVFFLLSGYVLTHSARNAFDPRRFVVRRFMRLAPVYFVTTLIAILATAHFEPLELVAGVPFAGRDPINSPSWSATWEFYLPVLAVLLRVRIPERIVTPALMLCLCLLGVADVGFAMGGHYYFARALLGLSAGHLLYRSRLDSNLPMYALVAALAAIMAAARYVPVIAMILPMVASATILAGRRSQTVLSSSPIQFLGMISYTLYMVHVPLLLATDRLADTGGNILAKLLVIGGAILLAWLLTVWVERPCMVGPKPAAQTAP